MSDPGICYLTLLQLLVYLDSAGLLIFVIRVSEPYVLNQIKADLIRCFCCKTTKQRKMKFQNESLSSFLNSAFNVEYVYLLLLGISTLHYKD